MPTIAAQRQYRMLIDTVAIDGKGLADTWRVTGITRMAAVDKLRRDFALPGAKKSLGEFREPLGLRPRFASTVR